MPWAVALAVGLMLGFAGPFGSNPAYPRPTRYAFWLGLTLAGFVAALAADAVLPRGKMLKGLLRTTAVALASALPMTFVVAWTMSLLQPGRTFSPLQLPALFAAVTAIQLLIVIVTGATRGATSEPTSTQEVSPGPDAAPIGFPASLLGKLPPDIRSEIIALETEDHYLRVHTAKGSALILMRMSDAVALLDPSLGAQVHRRWWVAEQTVASLSGEGSRLSLRLTDGKVVPVGRTFAANARARFGGRR